MAAQNCSTIPGRPGRARWRKGDPQRSGARDQARVANRLAGLLDSGRPYRALGESSVEGRDAQARPGPFSCPNAVLMDAGEDQRRTWRVKRSPMAKSTIHEARHWLERAKEARARAEQISDPESRLKMLEVADGYERMAVEVIRRESRPRSTEHRR